MLNKELQAKEIVSIAIKGGRIDLISGCVVECKSSLCTYCDMYKEGRCDKTVLTNWAYSEAKHSLTDGEYNFLKGLGTGYIARDKSGGLYWYLYPPKKNKGIWENTLGSEIIHIIPMFGLFEFVSENDDFSYRVEDVLRWREEEC